MIASLEIPALGLPVDAAAESMLAPCGRHARTACCGKCRHAAGHQPPSAMSTAASVEVKGAVAEVVAAPGRHP